MNYLIVINYEGKFYESGNIENLEKIFERESLVKPNEVLDQKDKKEVLDFIKNYQPNNCDKLVVHVKSHGFEKGICNTNPFEDGVGLESTLITWQELIDALDVLSKRCSTLMLNIGTVCYSNSILDFDTGGFNVFATTTKVSDPVFPRGFNKNFFNNTISSVMLSDNYIFQ